MTPQLPPPPEGCEVEVGHDGVIWRSLPRPKATLDGVCGFALAGAGVLAALTQSLALGLAAAAVVAVVALAVAVQSARRTEVRIDDRQLVVEHIGAMGTTTERIAMADLRSVEVGPSCLVARTRTERIVIGQGQPPGTVAWLHAALLLAIEGQARRAEAEGREYPFLRKAPEQLHAITRRPEPPT